MKKNIIFYACAAAALVFTSCQKETATSEGTELTPSGLEVITATTVSTKTTTLDGVDVLWENGDKISLFSLVPTDDPEKPNADFATYTTSLDAPCANATFVKDETNANIPTMFNNKYVAFYTKGSSTVTKSRNGYSIYAINNEQVATNGGDFASSIMYATSEDTDFRFSHMVSYVKFTVDENTTPFSKLTISSVDVSQYVATRIQVDFASDLLITLLPINTSTSKPYSQSSKTVSISTYDNDTFTPGTYYMAINADTYANGLKLTFSNGTSDYTKVTPSNVVMKAGAVANLGTIGTLEFEDAVIPETPAVLGKVYAENGSNLGVVFWVDETDSAKGKIISGTSDNLKWGDGTTKTYEWADNINTEDGIANQNYVLGVEGSNSTNYPAVYYCKDMGEGWRLPTIGEMESLILTYYGLTATYDTTSSYFFTDPYASNAKAFESELEKCGTDVVSLATSEATWYWTGQSYIKEGDSNSGKICRVRISPQILVSGANATNSCIVRCVRDVEFQ